MKKMLRNAVVLLLFAIFNYQLSTAHAQGTAFTYQGRLNAGGAVANGLYDFRFRLDADPAGNTILDTVFTNAVGVTNGLFITTIDFGTSWFNGSNYWLEVDVCTNKFGTYTVLNPFQSLAPTPYAVFANTASNVSGTVSAAQLGGAVPSANLTGTYGSAVTLSNPGNSLVGNFTGNGASVSNVNAVALNGIPAAGFWQTSGNNVGAGQILGSTNNQPLVIYAAGQRALLITTNPADSANFVGGSPVNIIDPGVEGSVIAGGGTANFLGLASANQVSGNFASIGGGSGNWIQSGSDHSVIVDGLNNLIASNDYQSVIVGGENNTNNSVWTFLGGGLVNGIQYGAEASFIGGGEGNLVQSNAQLAVIGGGYFNTNSGLVGSVGGGQQNYNSSQSGTIAGGQQNISTGQYQSTIGGGYNNQATNSYTTVAGGFQNIAGGPFAAVGGGNNNINISTAGTIAGGENNISSGATQSTVGGGYNNQATNSYATVAGGFENVAGGVTAAVGGGLYNVANGQDSFIGAGYNNVISVDDSFIGGGQQNFISVNADHSFIGGGNNNTISVFDSFIGGGQQNSIATNSDHAFIGGGWQAIMGPNNYEGVIAGGYVNNMGGFSGYSAIGGGQFNTIGTNSPNSVIPGGAGNVIGNNASDAFAAGFQAQALNQGAFVWADSQNAPFSSTANNQFLIRAQGGVGINMNNPGGASLYVRGDRTNGWPNSMSWFENTELGSNASPALRVLVDGSNAPSGALSVSVQGSGLIAQFGNGVGFVSQLDVNGNWTANSFNGSGGGLTGLNASQLTGALPAISGANLIALNASQLTSGTVPLTQLPTGVLTNNETTAVTLNGVFIHSDAANNFFAGPSAGNLTGPGVNNTAIGVATLFNNQGSVGNTAVGYEAFENNHTGNDNTALGYQTLLLSQQGHYNLAVGYQAGNALTTGSSNIYVGSPGLATEYSTIRIGTPGIQTNTLIAGVINGNGYGLTNLNLTASLFSGGVVPQSLLPGFQSSSNYIAVGGGQNNNIVASADHATIGGGYNNTIGVNDYQATIAGGYFNTILASSGYATIGGGQFNTNSGDEGTIAGGQYNMVSGQYQSTVGGGYKNTASGSYATVPGGFENVASGIASFAAGDNTTDGGYANAFVWGDGSRQSVAQGTNTFNVLATGGVWIFSGAYPAGVKLTTGSSAWATISDRNAKKNFAPVDTKAVLEKLAGIPMQQWNYKWEKDSDVPNIGPMAQDFKAAFYPGRDDKSITTLEFDGVELAAIQGLNQKIEEKDAEIQELKRKADKVDLLEQRLAELEQVVQSLTARK